jgi:hypothetical protein
VNLVSDEGSETLSARCVEVRAGAPLLNEFGLSELCRKVDRVYVLRR